MDEFFAMPQLKRMLARCDFVVVSVPLTSDTKSLIGRAELEAIRPTAYLINVSRGPVMDEPALIQALKERSIAGAGLDVFYEEPLPASSKLFDLDNVILSPHVASATVRYDDMATQLFAENLRRYLAGEPLLNVVDKHTGY